ncbi:MAG TPA: transglycosylase SLT domain-containing protein, partial [Myxococcales bacterium]|nr:transglycosylase SLT domain-containing protein [Myxococcales bacterium]
MNQEISLQIRVTRGPGAGTIYDVSAAGQYIFGKSQAARHQLADRAAERVQFTLTSQSSPRGLELSDPDSLRGVLVNGVVRRRATLASGDRIYFGATELLVCPRLPPRPPAKKRAPFALVAVAAVLLLGLLLLFIAQRREISALSRRKTALDQGIAALEARMQQESEPLALAELQHELDGLIGSAQQVSHELSPKAPVRSQQGDRLDVAIHRVLAKLEADTYAINPGFKKQVALQADRPDLRREIESKKNNWNLMTKVFAEHRLPGEMAYLAWVESRFDSEARNRASGAAGMWQLMPLTARRLHLRVDDECFDVSVTCSPDGDQGLGVDERLDPARSTRAAAASLESLSSA